MSAPTRAQEPVASRLTGIGVGRGSVVAPIARVAPVPTIPAAEAAVTDPDAASATVRDALREVADDLSAQAERAGDIAMRRMLQAASAIASDRALLAEAVRLIHEGHGPASALDRAAGHFEAVFSGAGGALAERVTDLRSVRDRAVATILGLPGPGLPVLRERSVVVAQDLSPADTAALDIALVAGIVTEQGGPTGHTAIIAKQLGIPCVVQTPDAMAIPPGTTVLVDALAGVVVVDPDPGVVAVSDRRRAGERELREIRGPGTTRDGRPVGLLANIGTPADAVACAHDAEGVGLFRTEVLYLDRRDAPPVAEQTSAYLRAIEAFDGRKVVIRVLDVGADKPLPFAVQSVEENPALGVRGYRLARTAPQLIDDQLAAIGAAVTGLAPDRRGDVWVMAPMVSTAAEARRFAARARALGIENVGVMIEVPAAALRAAEVLAEVDFVSIGTNDLAQYTMAADRLRGELADLLDPWQPAVLDLVALAARAGSASGKPVGVCGESAADPLMALVLTGLGVTSLSMAPASLAPVRYALRAHSFELCTRAAETALAATDAVSARAGVRALLDDEAYALLAGSD